MSENRYCIHKDGVINKYFAETRSFVILSHTYEYSTGVGECLFS
jgi:hypothetical protein